MRMARWFFPLVMAVGLVTAACGTTTPSAGGSNGSTLAVVDSKSAAYQNTAANVDPGTPLNRPAPDFTLTNQFGNKVSLSQYRGKVVVLAFLDSECTTICPLTSEEMVRAQEMLGPKAASEVTLMAVDANPIATAVSDVYAYSLAHGVVHKWNFVTGSKTELSKIWKEYGIYVAVIHGAIDHTPGVYIISPKGIEKRIYLTQMAYAGLGQQSEVFAQEIARVLPKPTKTSADVLHQALVQEDVVHSLNGVQLPLVTAKGEHGKIQLVDGKPRLLVFVASWLSELSNVPQQLKALNTYEADAKREGLPPLTVIDEAPTEPSPSSFLDTLKETAPLNYPVAIDTTGAVADQVGVQDITWYALINGEGKVVWAHDGSNNWLSTNALITAMKSHAAS